MTSMNLKLVGGTVDLDDLTIILRRGKKDEKTIPLSQLRSIRVMPARGLGLGFMEFRILGDDRPICVGSFDAVGSDVAIALGTADSQSIVALLDVVGRAGIAWYEVTSDSSVAEQAQGEAAGLLRPKSDGLARRATEAPGQPTQTSSPARAATQPTDVVADVPPGWYPDATNGTLVRWWDGQQWTAHTAPTQPSTPMPQAPATPKPASKPVPLLGRRERVIELEEALEQLGGMTYLQVQAATRDAQAQAAQAVRQADADIATARNTVAQLQSQIAALQFQLVDVRNTYNLQEVGLYDFEHPAESSAKLANELAVIRQQIKDCVRDKRATSATWTFTFNNSAAQGRKFVGDMSKMMLQAYNAEAENCVKSVRAGNLETARARLSRVVDQVARNGQMINLRITADYHRLRLRELELAARQLAAVEAEKEKAREERQQLREQRQAEQELRAERERLEKERQHYLNAMAALQARGDDTAVADMQAKLADVDKAIAEVDYRQANARAGYVYVISNIGAFGPDVVKIGMTRRLEPMDRVIELGDASVPFPYDVHVLLFADDAVSLETMLHHTFEAQRVNRVNRRREFFRTTPAQVLQALESNNVPIVEFHLEPEAEQWRLSGAMAAVPAEFADSKPASHLEDDD